MKKFPPDVCNKYRLQAVHSALFAAWLAEPPSCKKSTYALPPPGHPCGPWFASLSRCPRVGGLRTWSEPSAFSVEAVLLALPAFGSPCFSLRKSGGGSQTDGSGFVQALPKNLAGTAVHAFPGGAHDVRACVPLLLGHCGDSRRNKCLCYDVRRMIVLLTSPGGHPPGTEAMFYTTRKSVQRHAGWADHVLLIIDFSNAFDTDDGLRSSLKCCSACRACLLGQSGDLFPESPLSSKVGRAATGPAGRFLFALVPPLQTCSLPSWWLTWMVCAWPTNKPTMLLRRKPWWFFGGSSQRSTPIGQQFSLNTQKVNQQLTKVSYPNLCYYAGYIFGFI